MNYRFTIQVPMISALTEAFAAKFPGAVYHGSAASTFSLEGSQQPNPQDLQSFGACIINLEVFQGWTELSLEQTLEVLGAMEVAPVGAYSAPLTSSAPSGPRGRLSNDVRERILTLAGQGMPANLIAEETGRKLATVEAVIASLANGHEEGASEPSPASEEGEAPLAPPVAEEAPLAPAKGARNGRKVSV